MSQKQKVDDQLLRDYVNGKLDSAMEARVAAYVEQRPAVQARIAALSHDAFVRHVQAAVSSESVGLADPNSETQRLSAAVPSDVPLELAASPHYEIIKELGRGGMGVVYLARHTSIDRLEVLKVLNRKFYENEHAKNRFLNEIRAVAKLNHPSIVTCYGILPLNDLIVFSMEYIEGIDLHQFIHQNSPLPVSLACHFAEKIAGGLHAAHNRGLVHRDIKPSNIMVFRQDGKFGLKILDFGLVKVTDSASSAGLTQDGTVLGTPEYMSPEQVVNAANTDIRADIYSLGCTLYHMLTGGPPFTGSLGEVMLAHVHQPAPSVNTLRLDIPGDVAAIVAKMMEKQVDQRYTTPIEVQTSLRRFAANVNELSTDIVVIPHAETVDEIARASRDTSVPGLPLNVPIAEAVVVPSANPSPSISNLHVKSPGKQRSVPHSSGTPLWKHLVPLSILLISLFGLGAFVLYPLIIYRDENGEVVVEDLPDDSQIRFDNQTMEIQWDDQKKNAQIQNLPDQKQVQVNTDGLVVQGERVVIDNGSPTTPIANPRLEGSREGLTSVPPRSNVANNSTDWQSLFNGQNLDGWQYHGRQAGLWFVKNGDLQASGGYSDWSAFVEDLSLQMRTVREDFRNFELRLRMKLEPNALCSIVLRRYGEESAEVNFNTANNHKVGVTFWSSERWRGSTGSVVRNLSTPSLKPNQWFDVYIRFVENRLNVSVDNTPVLEADVHGCNHAGPIALWQTPNSKGTTLIDMIEVKTIAEAEPNKPSTNRPHSSGRPSGSISTAQNPRPRDLTAKELTALNSPLSEMLTLGSVLVGSDMMLTVLSRENENITVSLQEARPSFSKPLVRNQIASGKLLQGVLLLTEKDCEIIGFVSKSYRGDSMLELRGRTATKQNIQRSLFKSPVASAVYEDSYYSLLDGSDNWMDAKYRCDSLGGRLPIVTSSEQNQVVADLLAANKAKSAWLLGTDSQLEGSWIWFGTAQQMTYTNWEDDTGSGINDEDRDYLVLLASPSARWTSYPNETTDIPGLNESDRPKTVCQWPMAPFTTTEELTNRSIYDLKPEDVIKRMTLRYIADTVSSMLIREQAELARTFCQFVLQHHPDARQDSRVLFASRLENNPQLVSLNEVTLNRISLSDAESVATNEKEIRRNFMLTDHRGGSSFFIRTRDNVYHEKGIHMRSPSKMTFLLDRKWKTFTSSLSVVASYSTSADQPHLSFIVRGDGKELFRKQVSAKNEDFIIDVSGVMSLELIVERIGQDKSSKQAIWGSPIVSR